MPPGAPPKAAKSKFVLLSTRTMAVASLYAISTPETNVIYLSRTGTNLVVSWMTNDYSRSFFVYTTNLSMPIEGWMTPYEWGDLRTTNGPLVSVRFTNDLPTAFFRLVTVDTNTAGLGWVFALTNYQMIQSYTNVTKYIVHYGHQTNVYTDTQVLSGARLWHPLVLPTLQTNWCIGGEAHYGTNNAVMGFPESYWPPRK